MSQSLDVYREIAALVIREHTDRGPCLFSPTAIDDVAAAAAAVADPRGVDLSPVVIDAIDRAFRQAEIYCPHEGIDRRAEFGIAA